MNYKTTSIFRVCGLTLLLGLMLTSCAFQKYEANPLIPIEISKRYLSHDPSSQEFQQYLSSVNYSSNVFPIPIWGQSELTLSALFFNPELDLARSQWRAAVASQTTASQRPIPGISTKTENHSNDSGVSPWSMGLSIDLPVETAGKRQARIDRALSLSEAARLEIGQTAWKVRRQVTQNWISYEYIINFSQLLEREKSIREEFVTLLEKRLSSGLSSTIDLNNARIQLQKTQQQLNDISSKVPSVRAALAASAGLSPETLDKLHLNIANQSSYVSGVLIQQDLDTFADEARNNALLNRLDIRAALARYDAAEAKLRLEIAKQYPDIILSPGYSYDQGDRIWSLGIGALLTLLNKNKGPIQEAKALREVEASQFEVLQANVISMLNQSVAEFKASNENLRKTATLKQTFLNRQKQTEKQFSAGYADRLEILTTKLESMLAEQNELNAAHRFYLAKANLEDTMQRPMDNNFPVPNQ